MAIAANRRSERGSHDGPEDETQPSSATVSIRARHLTDTLEGCVEQGRVGGCVRVRADGHTFFCDLPPINSLLVIDRQGPLASANTDEEIVHIDP